LSFFPATAPTEIYTLSLHDALPISSGSAALLDPIELESLKLIMDASLRVHARHHFFTWTQGVLQDLVKHEALICALRNAEPMSLDRKSTRLNSSHVAISYAVFCLKK